MLFTQSRQGKNSSCIATARGMKSLHVLGFLTTHGRTSKNHMGVVLNILTQYEENGNDLGTQANNY